MAKPLIAEIWNKCEEGLGFASFITLNRQNAARHQDKLTWSEHRRSAPLRVSSALRQPSLTTRVSSRCFPLRLWISADFVFVWGGWTANHLLTSIDMDTFAITEGMVPESSNQDGQDADKAGTGQLPEGANKFQRAIAAWRGNSFELLRYPLSGLLDS